MRLTHIEPLDGDAAEQARGLLEGQYERRTGRAPQMELDFDVDGQDDGPVSERTRDEWIGEQA